jgi:hypothetical protein
MNWHDILERAGWTFIQGAVGAITAVPLVTDISGWEAVGVAAATGGVSALLSLLKTMAQERLGIIETRDVP